MPSLYLITPGAPAQSADINQLVLTLTGQQNTAVSVKNTDPIAYTLQLQNTDAAGKTLLIFGPDGTTVILRAQGNGVVASPDGSAGAPIVTTTHAQTLTNKTLTSPTINTAVFTNGALAPPAVALQTASAQLGADTNMAANTNTQLLTIVLAAGTWLIQGGLTVNSPTAGTNIDFTIRDETTGGGSYLTNGRTTIQAANGYQTVFASSIPYVIAAGTPTISLRAESLVNASTAYQWDGTYQGAGRATYLYAVRIA